MSELYHYGIKGQRWGVRRYQNPDGSLTPAGLVRYRIASKASQVSKNLSNKPRTYKNQEINLQKVSERGSLNNSEAKECVSIAKKMHDNYKQIEPKITNDVIKSVKSVNANMYGLDNRLKQINSLAAKIGSDAKSDGVSFKEASKGINDVIRYTAVLDNDSFVNGYKSIKNNLTNKGYSEEKCKNFFTKFRDGQVQHKALQTTYKSPQGAKFELQFQTLESQAAKELKIPLYEESRKIGTSPSRRNEIIKQMHELADNVTDPVGIHDILSHSELYHHGILGQKWGERNGPPYPLGGGSYTQTEQKAIKEARKKKYSRYNKKHYDEILKEGTVFKTLSYDKNRTKNSDMFFAAHTKVDIDHYKEFFDKPIPKPIYDKNGKEIGTGQFYKYSIQNAARKDIKVASEDSGAKAFQKLYTKDRDFYNFVTDPDRMKTRFTEGIHGMKPGYSKAIKSINALQNGNDITDKDLHNIYRIFNHVIPSDANGNARYAKDVTTQRAKFFNELKKEGYGAVLDTNDALYNSVQANSPVIVFDMNSIIPNIPKGSYQTTMKEVYTSKALTMARRFTGRM